MFKENSGINYYILTVFIIIVLAIFMYRPIRRQLILETEDSPIVNHPLYKLAVTLLALLISITPFLNLYYTYRYVRSRIVFWFLSRKIRQVANRIEKRGDIKVSEELKNITENIKNLGKED